MFKYELCVYTTDGNIKTFIVDSHEMKATIRKMNDDDIKTVSFEQFEYPDRDSENDRVDIFLKRNITRISGRTYLDLSEVGEE